MTSIRILFGLFLWLAVQVAAGQDTVYAREVIAHLCDQKMHGRGYVRHGDHRAAAYIRQQFEKEGLQPFHHEYFQTFPININTFPGNMILSLDGKSLAAGRDFIVDPSSPGINGIFVPVYLKAPDILKGMPDTLRYAAGKVLLVDVRDLALAKAGLKRKWSEWKNTQQRDNPFKLKGLIEITDEKLVFGAATRLSLIPVILMKGASFQRPAASLEMHIKNKFIEGYSTQNVAGYVQGTLYPDSFLVYTAHYDHLGLMGKEVFFPGANDNASGVAMMLGLARYFSTHPQRYSVLFIAFAGEEAGLLGSEFFVNHPLMELSKIKFLVNLDLVGTGIDGITVVNATEFLQKFETLSRINETGHYVVIIKKRGPACNSDHCPFFAKDVPCFFIYTLGGIAAYHNPDDRPETLPLTAFEGLTKLMIAFGREKLEL